VFDGDGLIITASHLAVFYRGRSVSYLVRGGGGCSTQSEHLQTKQL
jgi:hypothetical protein